MEQNIKQFIEEGEKKLIINSDGRVGSNNNPTAILNVQEFKNFKEEFIKNKAIFEEGEYEQYFVSFDDIADWWIEKLNSRQISLIKMIVEEIEGMKQTINPGGALDKSLDNAHKYGYNQALDTITSKLLSE